MPTFQTSVRLPRPRPEVFAFFSEAANLQRITPPELHFEILTPSPIAMQPGALIDYQLKLFGVRFRWRTLISRWEPPELFVDEQLRGPYRRWRHTHRFTEQGASTLMQDEVEYELPLGSWSAPVRPLVRRQLERIFTYRETVIRQVFATQA